MITDDMNDNGQVAHKREETANVSKNARDGEDIEIGSAVNSGENTSNTVSKSDPQRSVSDNDSFGGSHLGLAALTYFPEIGSSEHNTAGNPLNQFWF